MVCPKCGSDRVTIQTITESKTVKKRKSVWYWIFIGWWLEPILWIFLTLPRLLIALFGGKRKVISTTYSEAVCQNCGKTWRV
ncbi:MAG: hypothetical protein GX285_01590 [Clostridiales bacterium]|nr:hypothetical protein [Clostridiales bacterium]